MKIEKEVAPRFEDYLFDWDYKTYLSIGGYGSGKSYHTAFKIILKCLSEKRKVLVVREVYDTIKESCFDLFHEILDEMDLIDDSPKRTPVAMRTKVREKISPMEFIFPNGSRIIFKGMDKPAKVKSINGISIVWLEECSEIKYDGYKELLGRLRTPQSSLHFILTCNPVGRENWVYNHFFVREDDKTGEQTVVQSEEEFYELGTLVNNNVYYMHSVPDDNPWLPKEYLKTLDEIKTYDYPLYRTARWGRFGPSGVRVLPQFQIAKDALKFTAAIQAIPQANRYYGMDFGFEDSYNAVISCAVDTKESILYIYDEIYKNKVTDDVFIQHEKMIKLRNMQESILEQMKYDDEVRLNPLVADNEDPKAIAYYRQNGFYMKKCKKWAGSRLSNTRKIKRFKKIICSPKCTNTIRELRDLTYKKDAKGNTIYDQFNIDPHTFSALWYALDGVTVADVKERKNNSQSGSIYE